MTPSAELGRLCPSGGQPGWSGPRIYDNAGEDCSIYGGASRPALPRLREYDHKTDYEIFRKLAPTSGLLDSISPGAPWRRPPDHRLAGHGAELREFIDRGAYDFPPDSYKNMRQCGGFATPRGSWSSISTISKTLAYEPLPPYSECPIGHGCFRQSSA